MQIWQNTGKWFRLFTFDWVGIVLVVCFFGFIFWSLFNVRAMFNRYCDRLDKKQPDSKRGDFGSDQDLDHWPPPHDSSSGGDSVYRLSAIPSVSFKSNSFTICRPSPMLVQKMSEPGHGDSDSSGISTSTSLPDAGIS